MNLYFAEVVRNCNLGARGLDSMHADLVINIELTSNAETMTHRIGRCGRFGSRGEAVFILTESEMVDFSKMSKSMKLKVTKFADFENLVRHCQKGLDRTKFIRERENDDDREPEVVEESAEIQQIEDFEKPKTRSYPKPVIPPLWEVLNLPGPMHFMARPDQMNAEIAENCLAGKPEKTETPSIDKTDLDALSDGEFDQWRRAHPRETEPMMAQRFAENFQDSNFDEVDQNNEETEVGNYASENPLSNYFINSFLDESASEVESLSSGSDTSDTDFHTLYQKLYVRWRARWS